MKMNHSKNYRIKTVTKGDSVYHYPQEKILGFLWVPAGTNYFGEAFYDFKYCENFLKLHIESKQKPKVEYFYY